MTTVAIAIGMKQAKLSACYLAPPGAKFGHQGPNVSASLRDFELWAVHRSSGSWRHRSSDFSFDT